jgi:hypothetical protein
MVQLFQRNYLIHFSIIVLYYVIGVYTFNNYFHWSILDSVVCSTSSLITGQRGFFFPNETFRLFMSIYVTCGFLISSYGIYIFVKNELIKTKMKLNINNQVINIHKLFYERIIYPLLSIIGLVIISSYFFALNENWSVTDGFYFSIVLRASLFLQGITLYIYIYYIIVLICIYR